MRKFWSYGPPDTKLHYYAPRQELLNNVLLNLTGEDMDRGGHYITIWAPHQRGKTWVMHNALFTLRDNPQYQHFNVIHIPLESLKMVTDPQEIVKRLSEEILRALALDVKPDRLTSLYSLENIFSKEILTKPLILILDEFDALIPEAISGIVSVFRNIYLRQKQQSHLPSAERDYLLHGLALIGVRAVLGLENKSGSPFNIQHSVHIPNLTFAEVEAMFKWYEEESGQNVDQTVIERVFYETRGQPGLVGWLGELLTETYNKHNPTITDHDFEIVYAAAVDALPNSNIINIVSKAKQDPYKDLVLRLFQTDEKLPFHYDDPETNFLYMNGVIDQELVNETKRYIKFPCPFVQKQLFNFFAVQIFGQEGQLYPPFTDLSQTITETSLNIANLLTLHETYIQKNKGWLYQNAPRRADLRLYEAVYHFNLYAYLQRFMMRYGGNIWPEFPTGNGKVDLLLRYADQLFALEVKSFVDDYEYKKGLTQAARYAHQLHLPTITLILFVEAVDEANRRKYETPYPDPQTRVVVEPRFVVTN